MGVAESVHAGLPAHRGGQRCRDGDGDGDVDARRGDGCAEGEAEGWVRCIMSP